jgi:predicted metal-dependent hydrolase
MAERAALASPLVPGVPEVLELRAIAQRWRVVPSDTVTDRVAARRDDGFLLVMPSSCVTVSQQREFLRRWLLGRANAFLIPWLQRLGAGAGLTWGQVRIRWQKTLWGSCSARKTISLNGKLLFLPAEIVRYVLIHELCHTVHLNHSAHFWQLVAAHEPDYLRCDRLLREALHWVPPLFLGD